MKSAVDHVIKETQKRSYHHGWEQDPCFSTTFNDLNNIILTDKIEGLTVSQFKKGRDLINKAKRLFDEFLYPVQSGGELKKLQEASNMVQEALDLNPDPAGNLYHEGIRLKADINREVQNRINKQEQLKNERTIRRLKKQLKELEEEKGTKSNELGKRLASQNTSQTKEESISLDEYKLEQIREPENDTKSRDDRSNRPNISDLPSSLNNNSDAAPLSSERSDDEPPLNDNFEQGNGDKYI